MLIYFFAGFICLVWESLPYLGIGSGIVFGVIYCIRKDSKFLKMALLAALIGIGVLLIQKVNDRKMDQSAYTEQKRRDEDPEVAAMNLSASQQLSGMRAASASVYNGLQPNSNYPTGLPEVEPACTPWWNGYKAEWQVAKERRLHPEYEKMSPEDAHKKGLEHYKKQEYVSAIWAWECEVRKNPMAKDGINDIGIAYATLNNPPMALEYAQKALRVDPNFAHAHHTASQAFLNMGRYSSSKTSAEKAVAGGWEPWWSYEILGLALRGMNKQKEGNEALQKALKAKPDNLETKKFTDGEQFQPMWPVCKEQIAVRSQAIQEVLYGNASKNMAAHPISKETSEHIQKLISNLDPQFKGQTAKVLHDVALEMFQKRKDISAAAAWLTAANGVNDPREKALYQSWAARALTRAGDIKTATILIAQADAVAAKEQDVAYGAALVTFQSGNYHEAIARIEQAEKDGFNSDAFLSLHGAILLTLGKKGDARTTLHKMVKDYSKGRYFIGHYDPPDIWKGP